jgi:hypothetical protein
MTKKSVTSIRAARMKAVLVLLKVESLEAQKQCGL